MAKIFNKAVTLVGRIPDISTTQYLFWSLLATLHKEDQEQVVNYLLEQITTPTVQQDVQQEADR
jgi:hypothetical protein